MPRFVAVLVIFLVTGSLAQAAELELSIGGGVEPLPTGRFGLGVSLESEGSRLSLQTHLGGMIFPDDDGAVRPALGVSLTVFGQGSFAIGVDCTHVFRDQVVRHDRALDGSVTLATLTPQLVLRVDPQVDFLLIGHLGLGSSPSDEGALIPVVGLEAVIAMRL